MKLGEVKAALQAGTPVEYYADGTGWLSDGWHDVNMIMAIENNEDHPRVWLSIGNCGGVTLEGKRDIRERLRVKE